MPALDDELQRLPERFARVRDEGRIPGVAWGVVRDGELVASGGVGETRDALDATAPDADTVWRIASMTKSFTAATLLSLRDEGRLRLDDEVGAWVPQLEGWRGPSGDARAVTLRDLATMAAGLPTDDPWGDRQQGLPIAAFEALLAERPTLGRPTGIAFEYSNLGYAILGRVITAATGAEYREAVTARLLAPLGLADCAWDEEDVDPARLAHGYARVGDTLVREGRDPYGAFASMGGLYASVKGLARWVAGFLDAFPARDGEGAPHPLSRATRREMQQLGRVAWVEGEGGPAHRRGVVEAGGYGFGLFVRHRSDVGTVVGHGGGYPGYGTMMAWHPASGIGVVAAGNLRYAPVHSAATDELVRLVGADGVASRRARPLPAAEEASRVVERLLERWDDGAADAAFAMNMDLDVPRERRREAVATSVHAVGGPLRDEPAMPPETSSPGHRRWWRRGERGWLRVDLLVSPEPRPRIQLLEVTSILDAPPAVRAAAERLVGVAGSGEWPADLPAADAVHRAEVLCGLAVLAAWGGGALSLARQRAGDGTTTATWDLAGDAGTALGTLAVTVDAASGELTAVAVTTAEASPPVEG